jgi:hypothetical protein
MDDVKTAFGLIEKHIKAMEASQKGQTAQVFGDITEHLKRSMGFAPQPKNGQTVEESRPVPQKDITGI